MVKFLFNWTPNYKFHPLEIRLQSHPFVTFVNNDSCTWQLIKKNIDQPNESWLTSRRNWQFQLTLIENDELIKSATEVRVRLEITNFAHPERSLYREIEEKNVASDIVEKLKKIGMHCSFEIDSESLYNGEFSFGKTVKRLLIKCELELKFTINDDATKLSTVCKHNNDATETCENNTVGIGDILFRHILEEKVSPQFPDICMITSDGVTFNVQSDIVNRASPVFEGMFRAGNFKEGVRNEVIIKDINSEAMYEIMRYIYTQKVDEEAMKLFAPDILYAAEKYLLPEDLKKHCQNALQQTVNVDNVISYRQLAETYSLDELKNVSIQLIGENFLQILQQDEWANQDRDILLEELRYAQPMLKRTVKLDNVVSYLQLAETYSLEELKRVSIQFVVENFSQIRRKSEWANLSRVLLDEIYECIYSYKFTITNVGIL